MDMRQDTQRSVEKSLMNAMEEVKLMRAGKKAKPALDDLFKDIRKWVDEDKEENVGRNLHGAVWERYSLLCQETPFSPY